MIRESKRDRDGDSSGYNLTFHEGKVQGWGKGRERRLPWTFVDEGHKTLRSKNHLSVTQKANQGQT